MKPLSLLEILAVTTNEDLCRQAYRDSEGVLTWGFGLTASSGIAPGVYIHNPQPLDHCLKIFISVLNRYAEDVYQVFGGLLNEKGFAAALSFHWNTGEIKSATWPKLVIEAAELDGARKTAAAKEKYDEAHASFLSWDKPSSLIPRRTREADLFFCGKDYTKETVNEYTQVHPDLSIDWQSARQVNIIEALKNITETRPNERRMS